MGEFTARSGHLRGKDGHEKVIRAGETSGGTREETFVIQNLNSVLRFYGFSCKVISN